MASAISEETHSRRNRKLKEDPPFIDPDIPQVGKSADGKLLFGWPIEEGFAHVTVFRQHYEGNQYISVPLVLGDRPVIHIFKGIPAIIPMGLVNNLINMNDMMLPEDDLTDQAHPVRREAPHTPMPFSDPIPASAEEFAAYVIKQRGRKSVKELNMKK